ATILPIRRQHPKRGPQSLAGGELDARLEAAVREAALVGRVQPRGGVVPRAVGSGDGFLVGADDELAVADERIDGACRVVLQLVVAAARSVDLVSPVGWV